MSGRGKRLWAPNLTFDESYQQTLGFLTNCQKHNLISTHRNEKIELIQVYFLPDLWPTEGLIEATSVLRFGYSNNPVLDQQKQAMARLLSAAVKVHYLFAEEATVIHEPYLFSSPDLNNPGRFLYGLVYPVEQKGKRHSIVLAQWDLSLNASGLVKTQPKQKYPVVLSANCFSWLKKSDWKRLKQEMQDIPLFDTPQNRNSALNSVRSIINVNLFNHGLILDYPIDMNEEIKSIGGIFAVGLRKWFIPKGIDGDLAKEYLDYLNKMTPQERYALKWMTIRAYPK